MSKHYIEKPKKPACLQIQNIALVILSIIALSFLHPLFLFIFIGGMVTFYIYDIYNFKHSPEAILYSKNSKLYYYKKGMTIIEFVDIIEIKLQMDKKNNKYIQIDYKYDTFTKQLTIKDEKSQQIVEELNKEVNKAKAKATKKEEQKKKQTN